MKQVLFGRLIGIVYHTQEYNQIIMLGVTVCMQAFSIIQHNQAIKL